MVSIYTTAFINTDEVPAALCDNFPDYLAAPSTAVGRSVDVLNCIAELTAERTRLIIVFINVIHR